MIVVDPHVVPEALRGKPDRLIVAWLDAQPAETLFLTTVSYAELMLGVGRLPTGKRRTAIADAVDRVLHELFDGRILPFDLIAAKAYSRIVVHAQKQGHMLSIADAQIASIAQSLDFRIATRDEAFEHAGGTVINPWAQPTR